MGNVHFCETACVRGSVIPFTLPLFLFFICGAWLSSHGRHYLHRRAPLERMESVLEGRERTGVPDAILLEDYLSEKAFIDNLKKRYHENIIYVSILPRVTDSWIDSYRNVCSNMLQHRTNPRTLGYRKSKYK